MKEIYALGIGHNTPVFIDLAVTCGYSRDCREMLKIS